MKGLGRVKEDGRGDGKAMEGLVLVAKGREGGGQEKRDGSWKTMGRFSKPV
jgi:hypothetical protein